MSGKYVLPSFIVAMLVGASVVANAQSVSPSFDCSKASGEVEELICADAELAALDRKLSEVYQNALAAWPAEEASKQKALQRGWIGGRNDCWKQDEVRSCVEREYQTRTVELQIQSGQLMAPTPIGYACEGGENQPFFVTFYSETDPPSAVITYGNDQVIAFSAPAASGSKYSSGRVELWEHQGEAKVDWFGTELVCKPR